MTTSRARLTDLDLHRLIKSGDDDERATAAHKLCRTIDRADLSSADREAAEKILRVLAGDVAEMVRRALAVTLKSSDLLPRDVARRLARDVDTVAMPIIGFSPAFTDEDLIEIVRSGSSARQVAVASRPKVSRDVADVIASDAGELAVRALAANDNADLSERSMGRALERFSQSPELVAAMAYRPVLPMAITEKLIGLASEAVREHLVTRHALAPETAIQLAQYTRERATVDLIDQAGASTDLPTFVATLNARKALNASLLLRGLARGQMAFFEQGLSELAGVAHDRAWLMIHDAGPLGLKAIYDRAGLPPRLFQAFRAGVDTWRGMQAEGVALSGDRFQQRMLERFLTQRPNTPREDLTYLLERLDRAPEPEMLAANAA
ncbi:DUF2336 domain-containing protein [Brevundimonas sp. BAL450]|jgi:uncharacterized protein (DUF2336 family)|uniref:DUF2336 domain-containing protein n=1 Tax=Brevundimonas abyssalis TAR-001 TaxID=1391729 RepID=A0A8E0KHP5_9CAUL|nr:MULTISPECIES: DUF2336 domain-containing protein [Brevundimonas]MBG7615826.1 DUF2336 domain-containing protein [Brevundimonas sp. BAL450]GAD57956.1 hypothetical protein MBEBAB_0206 [Brevundimonas abyssalis TAR-001]